MATLKEHQQAMVDLLANGSGIPASASRLAHAMHDVLGYILCNNEQVGEEIASTIMQTVATTSPERRVKELENTVKQLHEQCQTYRKEIAFLKMARNNAEPEQAGCRKDDTQVRDCDDDGWIQWNGGECPVPGDTLVAIRLGDGTESPPYAAKSYYWSHDIFSSIVAYRVVEEAKPECKHTSWDDKGCGVKVCCDCGEYFK